MICVAACSPLVGVELETVPPDAPYLLKPSPHPQLFLDDYVVGSLFNLKREVQKPIKQDVVTLKMEYPWELRFATTCVIYDPDPGLFRMYYTAWPTEQDGEDWGDYICYAESQDGFHFTKPMLDIYPREGQPTNIIFKHTTEAGSMHVIRDAEDPDPERRYKAVFNERRPDPPKPLRIRPPAIENLPHGLFIVFSKDGIHWSGATQVSVTKVDTSASLVWFAPMKQYFVYTRAWGYFPFGKPSYCRITGVCTSGDAVHWTPKVGINLV